MSERPAEWNALAEAVREASRYAARNDLEGARSALYRFRESGPFTAHVRDAYNAQKRKTMVSALEVLASLVYPK